MPDQNATPPARLLVVDDEVRLMTALRDTLRDQGYDVTGVTSGMAAREALQAAPFDLLLTDLMMPGMDGIALLKAALETDANLVGIMMTGHGTIATAVEAMQVGAFDYILKPFKLSAVLPVLARALAVRQLRLQNVALQKRVAERTVALEAANQELEAFSYSVSHDLRAPLRAISGYAGMILQHHSAQIPGEARHKLQVVVTNVARMEQLIEDLLRLSRLSRQRLIREPVSVAALVEAVSRELLQECVGRAIQIKVGALPDCIGDPSLLRQVFVNLLSNAFKFTRGREAPVVEVGCRKEAGEAVYFVRDNGAGFDLQYAQKLFGVFQRMHPREEFEGTGIGLSIVQRIVHRHGGRIWAEAKVDAGATFYLTLEGPLQMSAD